MADQRSVEMLAFIFASRRFAYQRLAQRLSRSLSAFSRFKRENLDPVVKENQCAQYVDDAHQQSKFLEPRLNAYKRLD